MPDQSPVTDDTTALLARLRPSATSLIVTVFGDSILPHGGAVSLASLIQVMAALGLNDRAVRTAVFRLAKDGWLSATQQGRRSFYSLTDSARLRFQAAHRVIYGGGPEPWDGTWTVVLTGVLPTETRERLRGELFWQGFGQVFPGVLVHPAPDQAALRQTLLDTGATAMPVLAAHSQDWANGDSLQAITARAWDLAAIASRYEAFLANFRPLRAAASDELCFVQRTLLIHEYRRALLRDPMLPDALLPLDWPGAAARQLCQDLYRSVQSGAERFVMESMETAGGRLPAADARYYLRFGGLEAA